MDKQNKENAKLKDIINQDYLDLGINEFKVQESLFFNKMKISFSLIFFFILYVSSSFAQDKKFSTLDSLFNLLEINDRFMGTLSISENSKIIYSKSIGKEDVASGKLSNNLTKYRIGSISKMFTACLIFQAIEENKISLKQNINRFFPKITNAKEITIGNL